MEEFYQIMRYLPASYKSPQDQDYIAYLRDSFEQNYKNGKYQFALLACHMLYMSFVYFSVWQIKNIYKSEFKASSVFLANRDAKEDEIIDLKSPFSLSLVNERTIFRFLKFLDRPPKDLKAMQDLVKYRNNIAHSNGVIHCADQKTANLRLSEFLSQIDEIQQCMTPVIHNCLQEFLLSSFDPETREYTDPADQIREVFIHSNYCSEMDIHACLGFDIHSLKDHPHFIKIEELFSSLKKTCSEDA